MSTPGKDRDQQESIERIVALAKGDKGEPGEQGAPGKPGVPRQVRLAIVYLFVLNFVLIVLGYLFIVHTNDDNQASQARQAQLIEQKLCITLDKLASLTPPPGNPETNPSRAYDQGQHAILAQLGPDLGCPAGRKL